MPKAEVVIGKAKKTFIKGLFKKKEDESEKAFKEACSGFFTELAETVQKDFMGSKSFLGAGGKLKYVLLANAFLFYCWDAEEPLIEALLGKLAKKHNLEIEIEVEKPEVNLEMIVSGLRKLMKEISRDRILNDLSAQDFGDMICCRDALKRLDRRLKKVGES